MVHGSALIGRGNYLPTTSSGALRDGRPVYFYKRIPLIGTSMVADMSTNFPTERKSQRASAEEVLYYTIDHRRRVRTKGKA